MRRIFSWRIGSCKQATLSYDVYYRWFSLDPRVVNVMSRGYGEPFLSGVDADDEGSSAKAAGMHVVEVANADTLNYRYVPRTQEGASREDASGSVGSRCVDGRHRVDGSSRVR